VALFSVFCYLKAQNGYEPIHDPTGYDYIIKGELELKLTNSIDFKNETREEGTYTIKSPVFLSSPTLLLDPFIA
jgi:hypothetical protein